MVFKSPLVICLGMQRASSCYPGALEMVFISFLSIFDVLTSITHICVFEHPVGCQPFCWVDWQRWAEGLEWGRQQFCELKDGYWSMCWPLTTCGLTKDESEFMIISDTESRVNLQTWILKSSVSEQKTTDMTVIRLTKYPHKFRKTCYCFQLFITN